MRDYRGHRQSVPVTPIGQMKRLKKSDPIFLKGVHPLVKALFSSYDNFFREHDFTKSTDFNYYDLIQIADLWRDLFIAKKLFSGHITDGYTQKYFAQWEVALKQYGKNLEKEFQTSPFIRNDISSSRFVEPKNCEDAFFKEHQVLLKSYFSQENENSKTLDVWYKNLCQGNSPSASSSLRRSPSYRKDLVSFFNTPTVDESNKKNGLRLDCKPE